MLGFILGDGLGRRRRRGARTRVTVPLALVALLAVTLALALAIEWLLSAPGQFVAGCLIGAGAVLFIAQRRLRGTAHEAAAAPGRSARPSTGKPIYWGRQRIGWVDDAGRVHFDRGVSS